MHRECILGKIQNNAVKLSQIGEIVQNKWYAIQEHFPSVQLDSFIIMPNHIHGLIILNPGEKSGRGGVTPPEKIQTLNPGAATAPLQKPALGQVVGYFKFCTTKEVNQIRGMTGSRFWQRSFYDTIIRSEKQMDAIINYIRHNPINWKSDTEYLTT